MLVCGAFCSAGAAVASTAGADTATFTTPGEQPPFTVPAGVSSIHVVAIGGRGGVGRPDGGGLGGFGAIATADVSVTPGQVLYIEVAGNGSGPSGATAGKLGVNGGGTGGDGSGVLSAGGGGGGGGASDIRTLPVSGGALSLATRLITAAGGGGGSGAGGNGGAAGADAPPPGGGGAGTLAVGGNGGSPNGSMGMFGAGGTGGNGSAGGSTGGGGGGGGFYGGGGGAAFGAGSGGGGGGSTGFGSGVTGASSTPDTTGVPSVTLTYAPTTTGGTPPLAAVVTETLSPTAFRAARSGPSARAAKKRKRTGTRVTYALNVAASVRFTVQQSRPGRKVKHGKKTACDRPTKKNAAKKKCRRIVTLKGSFTRNGVAGTNKFRFTGRLNRRRLAAGKYRLVATPKANGKTGRPTKASFKIIP